MIVASQRGLGRGLVVPEMDQAGAELQVVPSSHPVRHLLKLVLVLGAAVAVAAGGQCQRSHGAADFIPRYDKRGKASGELDRPLLKETVEDQAGFGQEVARPEPRQVDRHGLIPQMKGPVQQGGIGLIHGRQPGMILKGVTGVQHRAGVDAGVNPRSPEVGVLGRSGAGIHRPGAGGGGKCRQGDEACPDPGPAGSSEGTDGAGADIGVGEVGGQGKAVEDGIGPGRAHREQLRGRDVVAESCRAPDQDGFEGPEEEDLVPVNGPTQRAPELLAVEDRPGQSPGVVLERIGRQPGIAKKIVGVPVKLVHAALGDGVGDETRIATILGGEVVGEQPVLLHGVQGNDLAWAGVVGVVVGASVQQEAPALGPLSVQGKADAPPHAGRCGPGADPHKIVGIAGQRGELGHDLRPDGGVQRGGLGADERDPPQFGDAGDDRADLHREVQNHGILDVELQVRLHDRAVAQQPDNHPVAARRQVGEPIESQPIGPGPKPLVGFDLGGGHLDLRQNLPLPVGHPAANGCRGAGQQRDGPCCPQGWD